MMIVTAELTGIEINRRQFNSYEDRLIKENWRTFAEHHNISLDQAPLYMSAATAREDFLDHKERITFCRTTLFRPWMCKCIHVFDDRASKSVQLTFYPNFLGKRLLDRTCVQVFRRCYVLFHCANLGPEDNRLSFIFHFRYGYLTCLERGQQKMTKDWWNLLNSAAKRGSLLVRNWTERDLLVKSDMRTWIFLRKTPTKVHGSR